MHHFRDYMAGARDIQLPDAPDPRGQLDNTMSVSCWLAGRYPEEYLAIFNSTQWLEHDEIVMGLGYTRLGSASALRGPAGTYPAATPFVRSSARSMIPSISSSTRRSSRSASSGIGRRSIDLSR